jgi:hypothetical protein
MNSNPLSGNQFTRHHNNTVVFDIGRDDIEGLFYLVFDFGCYRRAQILVQRMPGRGMFQRPGQPCKLILRITMHR